MAYNIRKVGVIGSGTMGGGIAMLLAGVSWHVFGTDEVPVVKKVAAPGASQLVLDTDEARFAGPARLAPLQEYHSQPDGSGGHTIKVYLPSRCALVLRQSHP